MMKLDDILEMWKKDSNIDTSLLDEATTQNSKNHAKYIELHSIIKLQLKKREMSQKILLRDKWLHFSGKLSKEKIDDYGWKYDPFDGMKIIKSDFHYFFESDTDLQKSEEQITYFKTLEEALREIVDTVKWRHQHIKNIIEFQKFTSGF
tara:strand:+ start:11427 stop:11873 length:447 start_codon:yes stop_codon:yes gene_type:complete